MKPLRIIVNADDLGATPAVNAAIRQGVERGGVTSATLMLTMPFWEEALETVVRPLNLPVGLHLSLTDGRCRSAPEAVPLLADAEGIFRCSAESLFLRLGFLPGGEELARQVRVELEAQLGAMRDLGLRCTHLDAHQHVHMIPAIFSLLRELGPRFGLTRCRLVREPFFAAFPVDRWGTALRRNNWLKWAVVRLLGVSDAHPFAAPDAYMGLLSSGCPSRCCLERFLRSRRPGEVVEIGVHLSLPQAAAARPSDMSADSFAFYAAPERQEELELVGDALLLPLVRELRGALVSFMALDATA